MKNKGFVITAAVVLGLVCLYQLSFTWVTAKVEKQAAEASMVNGKVNAKAYKRYLDSISNVEVYNLGLFKFTYLKCKQNELNLGLDLQGGMNVILDISKKDVLKALSNAEDDPTLIQILNETEAELASKNGDFVEVFAEKYTKAVPGGLAPLFVNKDNTLKADASDQQVVDYLKNQVNGAVSRAFDIIETRISQSNVAQPSIQRLGGGLLSVELPGVDNPEQVRQLLQQTAKLEFYEVYGNSQKNQFQGYKILESANKAIAAKKALEKQNDTSKAASLLTGFENTDKDTAKKDLNDLLASGTDSANTDSAKLAEEKLLNDNPLFMILQPNIDNNRNIAEGASVGYTTKSKMADVEAMFNDPAVKKVIPPDVKLAWSAMSLDNKGKNGTLYSLFLLKKSKDGKASLDGDVVVDAYPTQGNTGQVEISMRMDEVGARDWKFLTRNNKGNFVAIVLDDKVFSAPIVNEEIPNGMSSINGSFTVEEAEDLANILKAGKLPAPANIVAEDVVGPTLGKESISSGLYSLLIGFLSVIVFMVVYYSKGGVFAVIAVLLNVFFIIGILASQGAALTLPGMAGLVLTIGMAVDANVLIYERIKEELAGGKGFKSAIANGYKAAFSSIIDSNITTLIAGIIMTFAGSGPVYGFAIILIIGILSSLFTSILVTRLFVERNMDKGNTVSFKSILGGGIFNNANFDFIANRKKFYIVSSVIIVAGIAAMVAKGGLSTGIDFKGGWSYYIQVPEGTKVTSTEIKKQLDTKLANSSNEVKTIGSDNRFKIVTTYLLNSTSDNVADSVAKDLVASLNQYNVTESSILQSAKVGPTVANKTRNKSLIVVVVSILAMFFYIIIRFKKYSFGLGATVALIHDVLMVFSAYALLGGILPFSLEIDQTFIAAMLTIVGYSINDSVVVFDRIREFITEFKSEKNMPALINQAINKTLSRTVVTSSTTLLVVLVLFLFGGEALKGFSFALLVGIGVGTYSSICIATPVVVDFLKKENK